MQLLRTTNHRNVLTLSIGAILLYAIALEAGFLGGGRLVEIGPLTLKMYLFGLAQIYMVYRVANGAKLPTSSVVLVCSFGMLLLFAAFVGMARNADIANISLDVSMSLYVVMLLFLELTVCSPERVKLLCRILEFCAVSLSLLYLIVLILLFVGVIHFLALYSFVSSANNDIMFRGSTGLMEYKGTLYVAIGSLLLMFRKGKLNKALSIFTFVAVIATFTRGFIVGFAGAAIVHLVTGRESLKRKIVYIAIGMALVAGLLTISSPFTEKHSESDQMRIITLQQVGNRTTPLSFFFGQGLGEGVPIRPVHMEVAFAEIFYKQGLLGLLWWGAAMGLVVWRYRAVVDTQYEIAQPLLLAVVLDYCLSATNPYVNTPIGMFVLFAALAGLQGLKSRNLEVPEAKELTNANPDCGAVRFPS